LVALAADKVLEVARAPAVGSLAKEAVQEKRAPGADRILMLEQEFRPTPDREAQARE